MIVRIKSRNDDVWIRMEGQYWSLVEAEERATPFIHERQANFVFRGMPQDIKDEFALVVEKDR
jgi:hypothetical protein